MYKIRLECHEPNGTRYLDFPAVDVIYPTKSDAYDAAYSMAEDEVETLNEGADPGVSFGICEDQNPNEVCVNYYYNEEGDTTGNTELVTRYFFVEV